MKKDHEQQTKRAVKSKTKGQKKYYSFVNIFTKYFFKGGTDIVHPLKSITVYKRNPVDRLCWLSFTCLIFPNYLEISFSAPNTKKIIQSSLNLISDGIYPCSPAKRTWFNINGSVVGENVSQNCIQSPSASLKYLKKIRMHRQQKNM